MQVHQSLLLHVPDPFVQVQVLDAARVEAAAATQDAMDFIAFLDQEFGEEGAVLAGYTCD